jgi:tellurite resistance protein TerC
MSGHSEEELDPDQNSIVKIAKKYYNISAEYDGAKFTTKLDGKFAFTPMFLALLMIEFCDVMFAFDSIPAIFSVTEDPFLVFTSNMFAILGLRSLYFALAGLLSLFKYLKYSLIVLLVFVGVKFMLHDLLPQDEQSKYLTTIFSLSFILLTLCSGIIVSIYMKPKVENHSENKATSAKEVASENQVVSDKSNPSE